MAPTRVRIPGWYCPHCHALIAYKEKKEFVNYDRIEKDGCVQVVVRNRVMLNKQRCQCEDVDQDVWKKLYI